MNTALLQFFKTYPQFSKNDFYMFTESYGGKYVPNIASSILMRQSTFCWQSLRLNIDSIL